MKRTLAILTLITLLISQATIFADSGIRAYVIESQNEEQKSSNQSNVMVAIPETPINGTTESRAEIITEKNYGDKVINKYPNATIFYGCEDENHLEITELSSKVLFDDGTEIKGDKYGFNKNQSTSERVGRINLTDKTGNGQLIIYAKYSDGTVKEFSFDVIVSSEPENKNFDIIILEVEISRTQDINKYYCLMKLENSWAGNEELFKDVVVLDESGNNCMVIDTFGIGQTALAFYLEVTNSNVNNEFVLKLPQNLVLKNNQFSNSLEKKFILPNIEMWEDNFIESIYPAEDAKYYINSQEEKLDVKIVLKSGFKLADRSKLLSPIDDEMIVNVENGQTVLTLPITVKNGKTYFITADSGFITSENEKIKSGKINYKFSVLLKDEINLPDDAIFTDVHPDHWAFNIVTDLVVNGIINGYPDGTFKPENNVTRAEAAKIISAAVKSTTNENLSFKDIENHWAKDYIKSISGAMPLKIGSDGEFDPDELATREEIAVCLVRMLKLNQTELVDLDEFKKRTTDYTSIREDLIDDFAIAIEANIMKGYEDGTFRPGYNITRSEMAVMISRIFDK